MASKQLKRDGVIKKVPLGKMHITSRHAQREKIDAKRVDYLVSRFDLDQFGMPTLSEHQDGEFYIIDGQHRIAALKRWLGNGWERQLLESYVYTGLTESQEAEKFLSLNDAKHVNCYDKFRVSVSAGRIDEVHISKIVEGARLCISQTKPGGISAVGTLKRIYQRSDGNTLARTLRITRDSFGDAGFQARVLDGIAHLCQRYDGVLDETVAKNRLSATRGGVNGLLNKAEVIHKQTGHAKGQCIAAAAVDIINAKRGGKKLPSWWKVQE